MTTRPLASHYSPKSIIDFYFSSTTCYTTTAVRAASCCWLLLLFVHLSVHDT